MDIITRHEGDHLIVQGDHAVFVLGRYAKEVWELCDGTRTLRDIANEAARKYLLPFDKAAAHLKLFLEQLRDKGLLTLQ